MVGLCGAIDGLQPMVIVVIRLAEAISTTSVELRHSGLGARAPGIGRYDLHQLRRAGPDDCPLQITSTNELILVNSRRRHNPLRPLWNAARR